jgi:hypothetical protein
MNGIIPCPIILKVVGRLLMAILQIALTLLYPYLFSIELAG